jgi:hypothetical protein
VPQGLEGNPAAALMGGSVVAVGLLLALNPTVARVLGGGGDGVTAAGFGGSDIDWSTCEAVLGDLGSCLDGAVDSGGGSGGDGGGGGGDGGGGDGGGGGSSS